MNAGRSRRLRRLIGVTGRTVILPLDIVVPVGPSDGSGDTGSLVDMAGEVGVDGVILRWGEAKRYADRLDPSVALVVRLSGATGLDGADLPQVTVNTVMASACIGADAVCVDLELGSERESDSSRQFAHVCEDAERLGIPVLAEVHVPPAEPEGVPEARSLAWGARTARELGADLVKVVHPGTAGGVGAVCELAEIPILIAGGARRDPRDALRAAAEAVAGGAAGTAFGRNVMGHEAPAAMQRALIEVVRGRRSVDDVWAALEPDDPRAAVRADGGRTQHV